MKYFSVLLFIVVMGCSGCNKDQKGPVIPKEEFTQVLIDIHLSDGTLAVLGYRVAKDSIRIEKYYNSIFSKYNISRLSFENTLKHYADKPDELNVIYENVMEQLTIMKGQYEEEEKEKDKD